MKKKRINIALMIAVASIWGVLIFKFFHKKKLPDLGPSAHSMDADFQLPTKIEKDTFQLNSYSRDPFLGTLIGEKSYKRTNASDTTSPKLGKKTKINNTPIKKFWPQIQYLGFVQESNSKQPLLLLKIDDRLYRKKSNGEFPLGLTVERFYMDSIVLKLNGDSKMIKK